MAKAAAKKSTYTDSSITVLEGLEAIRKRFDMYVGGKDSAANHLVNEVVDNSIDEVLNGYATKILVEYFPKDNRIVIEDDGRGLPTGIHPGKKKPTIEVLFTNLHAGGKFDKNSFKVSGGKNGIGVKATNALSEDLLVESFHNGEHYSMRFSKGKVTEKLKKIGNTKKHGTKVSFVPDSEIFEEFAKLKPEVIKDKLNQRAYINAGLVIEYKEGKEVTTFVHEKGIEDYLEDINTNPMSDPIGFSFSDSKGNEYQVVLNYANESSENILSFVNGITTSKGTHETGFKTGMTTAMLEYIKKNKLLPKKFEKVEIKGEDVRSGLYAIINLKHVAPEFRGQVKDELSNSDVMGALRTATNENVTEWMEKNPAVAKRICDRIVAFAKGRNDAIAKREKIVSVSSSNSGLTFMASFVDCESNDISENEIIVIEGKSAGGSVKGSRDSKLQAVFPLRGKPKNTYGLSTGKILANRELNELIKVIFGTNDLKNIDYEKIRYGKIILLADADDDGYHIVSLLLTFIYKHFPQLIEDGRVYIALSPLYRVSMGGKFYYFKNDKEYDQFLIKEIGKRYKIDSNITLAKFIKNGVKYQRTFNTIQNRYNLGEDILSALENYSNAGYDLNGQEVFDMFNSDTDLQATRLKNGQMFVQGIQGDLWHNFTMDEAIVRDIESLSKIYGDLDLISYTDKKTKEQFEEEYFYETLDKFNNSVKFERTRFKGLGEANSDEIFETTINPEDRDLIQVTIDDMESAGEITTTLFGPNEDLRKEFILQYL
jgi:DNA gyrase subunit B